MLIGQTVKFISLNGFTSSVTSFFLFFFFLLLLWLFLYCASLLIATKRSILTLACSSPAAPSHLTLAQVHAITE